MLKNTKIIKDYSSDYVIEYFTNYILQDKPLFFGRIGGTDYRVVREYWNNKNIIDIDYDNLIYRVKNQNGYFDFDNNKENFRKYLDDMIIYYKNTDDVFYCNKDLIDGIGTNSLTIFDENFLNYILDGKTILNYTFIELLTPFLKSFSKFAEGKKILIISPLSKSIEHQYKNKDNLYLNYKFPNFKLITYNTKITYNSSDDNKETLNVSTNNWHEECQRMKNEINNIDFDIALISSGSYSMFLGNYIKYNMNKKAIYFGGILNVMFNIYGGRFFVEDHHSYYKTSGLNPETMIDPIENDDIINIKGGRNGGWSESLNAYFGKNKR